MKKVAILTLNGNNNYGNRLQNYALQETLKKLGFYVESIWIKDKFLLRYKKYIKNIIKYFLPKWHYYIKKEINIKKFTNKKIKTNIINRYKVTELNLKYDYFIVGSDQVWNYNHVPNLEDYFLEFSDINKTISYAASFGVSEVKEKFKEKFKKGLNHINNISVREEQGRLIIKELINKDVEVLVDPTLLLEKQEWRKISKKIKKIEKEYILTYFLGENYKKDEILKLSKKENLEVINLCDIKEKQNYFYGIEEFIYLFDNAKIIFTDSFHACVFSMIFSKPFFVFDRKEKGLDSMNSRLDTLLKKFDQEYRKISSINDIENVFYRNYEVFEEKLKNEKYKSMMFLKKALKLEEK